MYSAENIGKSVSIIAKVVSLLETQYGYQPKTTDGTEAEFVPAKYLPGVMPKYYYRQGGDSKTALQCSVLSLLCAAGLPMPSADDLSKVVKAMQDKKLLVEYTPAVTIAETESYIKAFWSRQFKVGGYGKNTTPKSPDGFVFGVYTCHSKKAQNPTSSKTNRVMALPADVLDILAGVE